MKKISLFTLALIQFVLVNAQDTQSKASATETTSKKGFGIGVNASTNGIGGHLGYSFLENGKLMTRLEANYLNYTVTDFGLDFSTTPMLLNGSLTLGSVGIYADWHPFGNAFRLTGGVAYMLSKVNTVATLVDSTKQGDLMLPPDEVGSLIIDVTPASIAPYIGLGFGRAVPKKRVGFSFEVGAYYIGAPNVSFVTTGMLTPTSSQGEVLAENLEGGQILPRLSFSLNFRISK